MSDVFLSHNSQDKPVVREIARWLEADGLGVWLDEWHLTPGRPWQRELEEALEATKSIAVFVGSYGLGRWEEPEMRAALSMSVARGIPVIPVLLSGGPEPNDLPTFLKAYSCVDMRLGPNDLSLYLLACGIRGLSPGASIDEPPPTTSSTSNHFSESQLHYFCYISAYKLEQFLAQVPAQPAADDFTNAHANDDLTSAGTHASLPRLFTNGSTYGHQTKRESHSSRHMQLIEKLAFLWTQLCCMNRIGLIDDLTPLASSAYDLYYLRCPLRMFEHDNHMALLETIGRTLRIELSCSLKYFSEYSNANIPFAVHSGNYHFFHGKSTPIFDAALIPIELSNSTLIATPLFLAITSSSGLIL